MAVRPPPALYQICRCRASRMSGSIFISIFLWPDRLYSTVVELHFADCSSSSSYYYCRWPLERVEMPRRFSVPRAPRRNSQPRDECPDQETIDAFDYLFVPERHRHRRTFVHQGEFTTFGVSIRRAIDERNDSRTSVHNADHIYSFDRDAKSSSRPSSYQ